MSTGEQVPAIGEQTEPMTDAQSELIEARVRWLEHQLGRPIAPAKLRTKVAQQIANNDGMWKRGRKFFVPDQTEPAFVFRPPARTP